MPSQFPPTSKLPTPPSSTSSPSPSLNPTVRRRKRATFVHRAEVFGATGIIRHLKIRHVAPRESVDDSTASTARWVKDARARSIVEVGMRQQMEKWPCWNCGERSCLVRTKDTVVRGSGQAFDIISWVIPLCSASACTDASHACLQQLETALADPPPKPAKSAPVEEGMRFPGDLAALGEIGETVDGRIDFLKFAVGWLLAREAKKCAWGPCRREKRE